MTPKLSATPGLAALAAIGAACALAGAAWYAALMRPLWLAVAAGPICGHRGLLVAHCPPCYAALALVVAGLGAVAAARALRRRAAVAKAAGRR